MFTIKFDPKLWKTPTVYASEKNISPQAVSNAVGRKKLQRVEVKELGLILVADITAPPVEISRCNS